MSFFTPLSLKQKKLTLYLVWALVILIGPITVFLTTPFSSATNDPIVFTNYLQRISGLLAFSLLFVQIILGAKLNDWTKILGARAYKLHIVQGILTFAFIFVHPVFYSLTFLQTDGVLKSFLLPDYSSQTEIYISFGRFAFSLILLSVISSYFRTKLVFLRKNWRFVHILNYLAFYFVSFHLYKIGTDAKSAPFIYLFWLSVVSVSYLTTERAWGFVKNGISILKT